MHRCMHRQNSTKSSLCEGCPEVFKNLHPHWDFLQFCLKTVILSLLVRSQTTPIYPKLHCRMQVTCLRSPGWLGGRSGGLWTFMSPSFELTSSFPGTEMLSLLSASINPTPSMYSSSCSEQKQGLPLCSPSPLVTC